ncbi:hypothetical protein ACH4S8_03295 [Streptomyces sp. NPDC021080]|uniref:hypothetical protein n=1 Tax=Streptomyces sp. NPDC021080 TaxID=3365110 RepID=UPI0037ADAC02
MESVTMESGGRPNDNAHVVRWGRRRFLAHLPGALALSAMGVLGVSALVAGSAVGALFVLPILAYAWWMRPAWRHRKDVMAFDINGFWWLRGQDARLIPWDSLAGVTIHQDHSFFSHQNIKTLELCPLGGDENAAPWMRPFVRARKPLRPGLPGFSYTIDVTLCHSRCESALWRWVPQKLRHEARTAAWSFFDAR